jgi:hypothetical protein
MYSVITGVIFARSHGKHTLVISNFLDDYSVHKYSEISDILDLDEMNRILEWLNIRLVGYTEETRSNGRWYNTMCYPAWADHRLFDIVLRAIRFTPFFVSVAKRFTDKIPVGAQINAIHLRIEDDAIKHWSNVNQMSEDEFRNDLSQRYIDLIKEHVDKTDVNLILSYSTNNTVLDFMKENGYHYIVTDKDTTMGREKNAIVDTIIAESCNKVMIANINFDDSLGSSFSYFVAKRLKDNIKCVTIDIRNLKIPNRTYTTPV